MIIRRKIYKNIFFSLGAMALASVFFVGSAHAAPATFTVTSTDDSGPGTLRQAILDANVNGNTLDNDLINFAIAGSGVHTIELATELPDVVEPVTIDASTQPGSTPNTAVAPNPFNGTVTIELDFQYASNSIGLYLDTGAIGSILRGFSFFSTTSTTTGRLIEVSADQVTLEGLYGGIRADGTTVVDSIRLVPNPSESLMLVRVINANDCVIGGSTAAARNAFAALYGTVAQGTIGIAQGSTGCEVWGNYIGLAPDGITDAGGEFLGDFVLNSTGLNIGGSDTITGGASAAARNVISGSDAVNLAIAGSRNTVQGNYIGTDYTGSVREAISNGAGVGISGGGTIEENLIGGDGPGEGNVIAGVAGAAVAVNSFELQMIPIEFTPTKNAVLGNAIRSVQVLDYVDFGSSNLALDLLAQVDTDGNLFPDEFPGRGPNANDAGDVDAGANDGMNTPVIKTAQQIGDQLTITYDLDAADSPSNTYRVEFFANSESTIFGIGPGEELIGAVPASTNGIGKSVTFTVSGDYTNKALSATTTAVDGTTSTGYGSTSEFAPNISIGSATDFDSDGAADTVEDQAPNAGDGNNDGTADRLQPTVTSYEIDSTGIYSTLVTSGCSENGTVASVDVSSLAKADPGKSYPYGLVDFTLNCSRGDTVNVTKYVFVDDQPSEFSLRKFNPITVAYTDVPGSTISAQTIGDAPALVSTYAITDGGELDDDGVANGIIVDPVGLATTQSLAQTGENLWAWLVSSLVIVGGAYIVRRKVMA